MSLTPEEIKSLIESRKIEALIKKIPEKLELVLYVYGHDILGDLSAGGYEDYFPETPYEPEDEQSYLYGRKFDGGGTGLALEILKVEHMNEMTAKWHGEIVFMQIDGQIRSFIPSPQGTETPWEDALDLFYERARKLEKPIKQAKEEEAKIDRQTRFGKVMKFLKDTWGIG